MEPRTPGPGDERFELEPAEGRSQPTAWRHQQHRFLLVKGFAEGQKQRTFGSPQWRAQIEATNLGSPDDHQEIVGLLRSRQHALEEHFVLTVPDTGLGALKHAVDHCQRMIWIEAADSVEPGMADDLGSRSDLSVDRNAGRVEVRCPCESLRIVLVHPKAPAPNTPKACNRDEHLGYTPFSRLFFCRSTYNSSCSRLIWPTKAALSPLAPAGSACGAPLSSARIRPTFLDNTSSRVERSATISNLCRSSS